MVYHASLFVPILCLHIATTSYLGENALNPAEWWKRNDFGSVELLDTSAYIDPYRTDTSRFRPFVYGYVSNSNTAIERTDSFEDCMGKCITDSNCKAFEINMLFLPFRCRLSVQPCIDGKCSEFTSHPQWKHFVRDNDAISVKTSMEPHTLDNTYKPRQNSKMTGFAITKFTNGTAFDYIEVETSDASPDTIAIDYVWFEYQKYHDSLWIKCQRVQLPQIQTRYRIQNLCIHYEFSGTVPDHQCDVLKKSWENYPITPRTTKIGTINFEDTYPTLQDCSDSLVIKAGKTSAIEYIKLEKGDVHALRLFSNVGKFNIENESKMKLVSSSKTYTDSDTIITKFPQNNVFALPHTSTIEDWYYDILKDGGHLWCRDPKHITDGVIAQNVFQRMHHTCYYRGSTLSKTSNSAKSGKERIHYFNAQQCSFDSAPNCTKAWVVIHEKCQGWNYCAVTLGEASEIQITHKSGDFPSVSWKSEWNRAQSEDSEHNWSIDYMTDIFLVLHDCEHGTFDNFLGCSQCTSQYYEAMYDPYIKFQDLRIYKYNKTSQFCRPQSGIWENECRPNQFCPKGLGNSEFTDHNYWQCRTNFNGNQSVVTATESTKESVNQGFGCVKS